MIKMSYKSLWVSVFAVVFASACVTSVFAQTDPAVSQPAAAAPAENAVPAATDAAPVAVQPQPADAQAGVAAPDAAAVAAVAVVPKPEPVPDFSKVSINLSLMFSPAELALMQGASQGIVTGTAILDAQNKGAPIAQQRQIRLSGVLFRGENDWIVWLNGHKVTPSKLLPEIIGIKVDTDKIHLRWFDAGLNKVINIMMRPRQVYDIGTAVLLPE